MSTNSSGTANSSGKANSFARLKEAQEAKKAAAAAAAQKKNDDLTAQGYTSEIEKRSMIKAPTYESLRDPETGELQSQYAYDPSKSEAYGVLRDQAMAAPGESPWAKMQMEKQQLSEQGALDNTATSSAQAVAQAQSNLARMGGLGGGARTRLASQGAKDSMLAQQGTRRAGIEQRLGIGEADIGRQQDMLGRLADEQLGGQKLNLGSLTGDVKDQAKFDLNRYEQQMGAWGAEQTANAQRAAAKKGGKKK